MFKAFVPCFPTKADQQSCASTSYTPGETILGLSDATMLTVRQVLNQHKRFDETKA